MELRHLRCFVALAEELHFGRAAKRMHLSQPPLSATIADLEAELGVRLFERTTRVVTRTVAGDAFYVRARDLLRRADETASAMRRVALGELGALRIGYSTAATYRVLPRAIAEIRARLPDLELVLREMSSAEQADALRDDVVDVGLLCLPVPSDGLHVEVLTSDRMVVALPAGHPLAERTTVHVRALDGAQAVAARATIEPGWANAATVALARAGVTLDVVQEADTKLAVLALVASGVGISVLAASTTEIVRNDVAYRPIRGITQRLELAVASRAQASHPAIGPVTRAIRLGARAR